MVEIANRLAEFRESTGMGVRTFAKRITATGYPVSYGSVAAYEKEIGGTDKIPAEYLAAVCRAFKVSADYVLGLSDDPNPPTVAESQRVIAQIERLLLKLRTTQKKAAVDDPDDAARRAGHTAAHAEEVRLRGRKRASGEGPKPPAAHQQEGAESD